MADEHATLTLTLTDEMTEPVQSISKAFADLKKSIEETGQKGEEAHKSIADNSRRTKDTTEETHKSMHEGFSKLLEPLEKVTLTIGNLPEGFHETTKVLREVEHVTSLFSGTLSRVTTGALGFAAAAVGGGIAAYGMVKHMAEANEAARNMRIQLGESTDGGIRTINSLAKSVGVGADQAQAGFANFAKMYQ